MTEEEKQGLASLAQAVRTVMKMVIIETAERQALEMRLQAEGLLPPEEHQKARRIQLAAAALLVQQVDDIFDHGDAAKFRDILRAFEGPLQ